jgi:hypothetical protein
MRRDIEMKSLARYLELIVDPTLEDFTKNPTSLRHAFLACVAIFHAIDRASEEKGISRGNLRREWGKTAEFKIVDIVAHHFKHVVSDDEKNIERRRKPSIPITFVLGFNDAGDQMELRNLFFVIRDAVKFVHKQAET